MAHPAVREARTDDPRSASRENVPEKPQTSGNEEHEDSPALNWRDVGRVLFVAVAAGAIWLGRNSSIPYFNAIGAACTLLGGYPIFREAYDNIVHRRMTMELSMAIAIV